MVIGVSRLADLPRSVLMASESREVGTRGYVFHAGTAMPEYAELLVPDEEFLTQWVDVATVSERSELERWLAGEPRSL